MNIRFYPPREGLTYEEIRRGDIWLYADVRCPHCGNDVSVSNTHYVGGPCPKCGGLTSGTSSCPVVRPQGGDTYAPTELDRAYAEAELDKAAPLGLTATTERVYVSSVQEETQKATLSVAREFDKKLAEQFLTNKLTDAPTGVEVIMAELGWGDDEDDRPTDPADRMDVV